MVLFPSPADLAGWPGAPEVSSVRLPLGLHQSEVARATCHATCHGGTEARLSGTLLGRWSSIVWCVPLRWQAASPSMLIAPTQQSHTLNVYRRQRSGLATGSPINFLTFVSMLACVQLVSGNPPAPGRKNVSVASLQDFSRSSSRKIHVHSFLVSDCEDHNTPSVCRSLFPRRVCLNRQRFRAGGS